jgi:hypothetical protein
MQDIANNSRDQTGSRLVQSLFENEDKKKQDSIVEQLKPVALQLMSDTFGNFVIQKVLEKGTK